METAPDFGVRRRRRSRVARVSEDPVPLNGPLGACRVQPPRRCVLESSAPRRSALVLQLLLLILGLLGAGAVAVAYRGVPGSPSAHLDTYRGSHASAAAWGVGLPTLLPHVRGGAQDENDGSDSDDATDGGEEAGTETAPATEGDSPEAVSVAVDATTTPTVANEESDSEDETENETVTNELVDREPGGYSDNGDDGDEEEVADEIAEPAAPVHPALSNELVPVNVTTGLGRGLLLEQSLEMTVLRSRSVANLKENLRRMMPGKPPVTLLRLRLGPRVLADDVLVDELLDDEEDEDEKDEMGGGARLTLMLDMIPPVDPKMVLLPESQLDDLTPSQLLDAYATNEAALYHNAAMMLEEEENDDDRSRANIAALSNVDDAEQQDENAVASKLQPPVSVTALLKERAARIRRDMESTLLVSASAQAVLAEPIAPSHKAMNLQKREVRGQRVRQVAQAGVKTTMKRKIQRNFNVNWPDTVRQICLFLFFGYFGGRSPTSRAILLLGAPSVILFQARPVKVWLRRVIYMVLSHPPLIILSLLPAPQQSLLSVNVDEVMETVYGDYFRRRRADESGQLIQDDEADEGSEDGSTDDDYDGED